MLENAPRSPRTKWAKGLAIMNAGKPMTKPGQFQAILDRYEAGDSITLIAKDLSITPGAIYRAIIRQDPNAWAEYRTARALTDLDKAENNLEGASDGVTVSRVREQIKLAQWYLERTCRDVFGDKLQVEHTVSLETGEVLGEALDLVRSIRRRKEKVVNPED